MKSYAVTLILALFIPLFLPLPLYGQELEHVATVAGLPEQRASLEVEWEQVENAAGYQLRLTPEAGGEPLVFETAANQIREMVPVGFYKVEIRSLNRATNEYGKWGAPMSIEVVSKVVQLLSPEHNSVTPASDGRRASVVFRWHPIQGAKKYILKLWTHDEERSVEFMSARTEKRLSLLTGRVYYWQVTFESANAVTYEGEPQIYMFTLLGKQLTTPVVKQKPHVPPIDTARWDSSGGAKTYSAKLTQRALDQKDWSAHSETKNTAENVWKLGQKLKPGAYRLEVQAHAPNRVSSDPATVDFLVKPTEQQLRRAMLSVDPKWEFGKSPDKTADKSASESLNRSPRKSPDNSESAK